MRLFYFLACIVMIGFLSQACYAERAWDSGPDKLVLKAGDDFKKVSPGQDDISLELFSKTKNAQLILTKAGVLQSKKAKSGESSTQVVTTSDFIKAFPLLSADNALKAHSDPIKLQVDGIPSVLYELESTEMSSYQTLYAYVGRGKLPYAVILNYPSPRDPKMVGLMKQILSAVQHK